MYAVAPSALRKLITEVRAAGVDPTSLLARVGLKPSPGLRVVPTAQFLAFKGLAAEAAGDPAFGLTLAVGGDLARWDLLGHLVQHSTTLGDALDVFARYQAIWQTGLEMTCRVEGDQAIVAYRQPPDAAGLGAWVDAQQSLGESYTLAGRMVGHRVPLELVRLRQPAPADKRRFTQVFGDAPVDFAADEDALYLTAAALDLPLGGDPSLVPYLQMAAEGLMKQSTVAAPTLVERIGQLIQATLPDVLELEQAARSLGLGQRTLARRLADEGTSWREVLDATRHQLAEGLIDNPDLTLAEVAWRLGYASQTSFHRAFTRWFGETPGARRARLTAG